MGFNPTAPTVGHQPQHEGLAALLSHDSDSIYFGHRSTSESGGRYDEVLTATVAHVLDLTEVEQSQLTPENVFQGVTSILETRQKASSSRASTEFSSPSTSAPQDQVTHTTKDTRAGRLGPDRVLIDHSATRGQLSYDQSGLAVESLASFSSLRATTCVFAGKWQFEATIHTDGIQQIGWATIMCPFTTEEGVGDAPDSYAYDGKRVRKWNVKCVPYGQPWAVGDVIGSCLDLDRGELIFYRNGVSLGVAYHNIRMMQPHLAYFPAVSLSYTEKCEMNFGARPFLYPVPGFDPLQASPSCETMSFGSYLCRCLERLAHLSCRGSNIQKSWLGSSGWCLSGSTGSTLSGIPSAPEPLVLEAPADTPSKQQRKEPPCKPLMWDDVVLLAAAVAEHLVPLLLQQPMHMEYCLHALVLPMLLRLHGHGEPHNPAAASTAAKLLLATMDPRDAESLATALLDALAKRCTTAPLLTEQFPHSGSYPFLSLACCLVRSVPLMCGALLRHPSLHPLLEAFMMRKPPSSEDLKALLPVVWWRGCKDETASEARMKAALQAFSGALSKVEDCQYTLLTTLISTPAQGDPRDDAFMAFLRYLVQKNRGATRDIQPPGLSDANVLVSVWFCLLRILRCVLWQVDSLPAGDMFIKAASQGDINPTNDLSRMGGLVSYLTREAPVSPADQEPVPVQPPPPFKGVVVDSAAAALKREHITEVLNIALSLYSLKVVNSVRQIQSMFQALAGSLQGLEEVERRITRGPDTTPAAANTSAGGAAAAAPAAPATEAAEDVGATYLQEARNFLRQDILANVRCGRLLEATFYSGWRLEALLSCAIWVAHALLAAAQRGSLISYLPNCYMEFIMDTLLAYRKADAPFARPCELQDHGLDGMVSLLVTLLNDGRICNPDVKEALLACTSSLLESRDFIAVFERNSVACQRLVPTAVAMFDSRLWHPVSTILLRFTRGVGMGAMDESEASSPSSGSAQAVAQGCSKFRSLLQQHLQPDSPGFKSFMNRLFNTVNWAVTDFTVAVSEIYDMRSSVSAGRRVMVDDQQQARKALIMFRLTCNLLHLTEFLAVDVPAAFLSPACRLNMSRLLEIVPFVLSHFTTGSDARRLNELLSQRSGARPAGSGLLGPGVRLERHSLADQVSKPAALAPLVGALVALWRADSAAGSEAADPLRPSFVRCLADVVDERVRQQLDYALTINWRAAFPKSLTLDQDVEALQRLCTEVDALRKPTKDKSPARGAAATSATGVDAGSVPAGEGDDPPEELLDPITMTLMTDPVLLPDSGVTLDRSTIERHLLTQTTDPFSRRELSLDMVKPDEATRARVHAYLQARTQ